MDFFDNTKIGIAYNSYLHSNQDNILDLFDYVEIPVELLNYSPTVLEKIDKKLVLHCASLSLGGYSRPSVETTELIRNLIVETKTPWLGEHLAFISADKLDEHNHYEEYAPGEPYNIGYTVSPVMNDESVENIVQNVQYYTELFQKEILLENSPLYFSMPGNTMDQFDFINAICAKSNSGLLLDLTHLYISSKNFLFDAKKQIDRLPLEKVVEIHISGVSIEKTKYWDNHASQAPEIIFELLDIALQRSNPKAITLEYNWDSNFEIPLINEEFSKVRNVLERRTK